MGSVAGEPAHLPEGTIQPGKGLIEHRGQAASRDRAPDREGGQGPAESVQGERDRVSQTLTGRIRELTERYTTPLPRLTEEVELVLCSDTTCDLNRVILMVMEAMYRGAPFDRVVFGLPPTKRDVVLGFLDKIADVASLDAQ